MRVIALALLVFSGIWPLIIVYFVAAVLMKPQPVLPLESEGEREFYNSYASSRSMALQRLKRIYDDLDRRTPDREEGPTLVDVWARLPRPER